MEQLSAISVHRYDALCRGPAGPERRLTTFGWMIARVGWSGSLRISHREVEAGADVQSVVA